jgi:hypothetical protein
MHAHKVCLDQSAEVSALGRGACMLEWIQELGGDLKSIIVAVAGSVAG